MFLTFATFIYLKVWRSDTMSELSNVVIVSQMGLQLPVTSWFLFLVLDFAFAIVICLLFTFWVPGTPLFVEPCVSVFLCACLRPSRYLIMSLVCLMDPCPPCYLISVFPVCLSVHVSGLSMLALSSHCIWSLSFFLVYCK